MWLRLSARVGQRWRTCSTAWAMVDWSGRFNSRWSVPARSLRRAKRRTWIRMGGGGQCPSYRAAVAQMQGRHGRGTQDPGTNSPFADIHPPLYGRGRVFRAVVADDGDFVAVGQFHDLGAFEDDGFAGLEHEAACSRLMHFFDGLRADGGDVEAHIGIFIGDFEEGPAADFAELAGPFDHGIGAFEGFDSEDVLVE